MMLGLLVECVIIIGKFLRQHRPYTHLEWSPHRPALTRHPLRSRLLHRTSSLKKLPGNGSVKLRRSRAPVASKYASTVSQKESTQGKVPYKAKRKSVHHHLHRNLPHHILLHHSLPHHLLLHHSLPHHLPLLLLVLVLTLRLRIVTVHSVVLLPEKHPRRPRFLLRMRRYLRLGILLLPRTKRSRLCPRRSVLQITAFSFANHMFGHCLPKMSPGGRTGYLMSLCHPTGHR